MHLLYEAVEDKEKEGRGDDVKFRRGFREFFREGGNFHSWYCFTLFEMVSRKV